MREITVRSWSGNRRPLATFQLTKSGVRDALEYFANCDLAFGSCRIVIELAIGGEYFPIPMRASDAPAFLGAIELSVE